MDLRPYEESTDRDDLWSLKRAFERELGAGTGDEDKRDAYEGKLTSDYRTRYLDWVDRCMAEESNAVTVAERDGLVGYVFVLPESMAMIWDAAVLNEIYVSPAHRGTALADDLLAVALDVARSQSLPLDRLVLDVDPANDRAAAFYRRHGFMPWGEIVARDLTE